ncbi:MAG: hypothetical protein ACOC2C_01380 [Cyclonatronaceae bacterium]
MLVISGACSSSKKVESSRAATPLQIDGDFDDWPSGSIRNEVSDQFDVAISNDDDFVYIGVNFRNNRTWQQARDHGLRIYIDSDATFRRAFGIVFPVGIVSALGDVPGARKSYLENPNWENLPRNADLVERAEAQMRERVQLIRRSNKDDRIRPVQVSMEQLEANGIRVGMSEKSRVMSIEVRIPIDDGDEDYFAVIPNSNGTFNVDFEIEPLSYEEITGETVGYRTVDASDPRGQTGSVSGGRTGSQRSQQELDIENPRLYSILSYKYEARARIQLK